MPRRDANLNTRFTLHFPRNGMDFTDRPSRDVAAVSEKHLFSSFDTKAAVAAAAGEGGGSGERARATADRRSLAPMVANNRQCQVISLAVTAIAATANGRPRPPRAAAVVLSQRRRGARTKRSQ